MWQAIRLRFLGHIPATQYKEEVQIGARVYKRSLTLDLLTFSLAPAKYEIIPFLLIRRDGVPSELIENLGGAVNSLGPGHLKMSIKRLGGDFEIVAE